MLFIYAWLFFLFSTSVVALPAGESSGRSSRHKHQKVVISYGSTDRGSTPLPPPRPQTARPGGRTVYPTRDSRNGLWTAKQLQSHDYARYLLRYDGGAYILIRVDANFVITGRRVLRSRAETAPLVGTWVRVPTVDSPEDDRFKELVIARYPELPTIVAQIVPSPFSELDTMPNPPVHSGLRTDGYWVHADITRDISHYFWREILHIDGLGHTRVYRIFRLDDRFRRIQQRTLERREDFERLVGDYIRAPYDGMLYYTQIRYTKLSIRHDTTTPEGISLTTSYMPQPGD